MRILGLPLQFWDFEVFREIGNFCGGFLAMDEETRERKYLRWARIGIRRRFRQPLWTEKGPRVVFQPRMLIEQGSDNGYRGITDDSELEGEREEDGVWCKRAWCEWGNSLTCAQGRVWAWPVGGIRLWVCVIKG